MNIKAEHLAFWFLRLNGFLTIPNFVVHPEGPDEHGAYSQRTDVDVLGVRFPFRAENRERAMPDYPFFTNERSRPLVVFSEVKTGQCRLNGPWTSPESQNIQKVLCAGGFRPIACIDAIANALYDKGVWEDANIVIRIICFGDRHNSGLKRRHPDVEQLFWHLDVLPFIYQRFKDYHLEKRMHQQWDGDIKELFRVAQISNDKNQFVQSVHVAE